MPELKKRGRKNKAEQDPLVKEHDKDNKLALRKMSSLDKVKHLDTLPSAIKPWDRLAKESLVEYKIFKLYLEQGRDRSIHTTATLSSRSAYFITKLYHKNFWEKRTKAYDDDIVSKQLEDQANDHQNRIALHKQQKEQAFNAIFRGSMRALVKVVNRVERMTDEELNAMTPAEVFTQMSNLSRTIDIALQQSSVALGIEELMETLDIANRNALAKKDD